MKARNLIAAALFAALGSLQTARAEGAPTWTFTYNTSTKTATLTNVTAAEGEEIPAELSLPSSVNGYTVTAVGNNSFQGLAITSLTIPNTVTTIGYGAFANCTALKSVVFGSGLETIANGATSWSRNGANTNDPDSYAGYGAFGNCINLETVEFGENVRTIGAHAFSECESLKALNLPDSLTTIGANAFYQNKRLSRITFGEKIELIGYSAFMGCEMLTLVEFSAVPAPSVIIRENAFRNCVTLATLMLPNAILTLESNSFAGCRSLRKITVPSIISELSSGLLSPEKMPFLNEVTFAGLPPENIENAGLRAGIKIRYSNEYAEEWADAIETCGFTNATAYDPSEAATVIGGDSRYELSHEQSDRSIASITINADTAIDAFILTDGKVYDSVLRIVNTADGAVTLTLPAGYTYETFEGADPLTIPANSRNLLTITRTEENVFLVSREKLKVIQ